MRPEWRSRARARRCTDGSHDDCTGMRAVARLLAAQPDPFALVGTTIDERYAVESLVDAGGLSVVYRARRLLWDRPVAIRAFRGFETVHDEEREKLLRAFVREGAVLAELSERTTAIVQARDVATTTTPNGKWAAYMVLEWLDGKSLDAVLWQERRVGRPPRALDEAMALLDPIAGALAIAHGRGLCHGDLDPGSVILVGDPHAELVVKLLDFGLPASFREARRALGRARERFGAQRFAPPYATPEQCSEAYGVAGPWTDVFALALMLVELVTGRDPLGDGPAEQRARVVLDRNARPTPRALGACVTDAVEQVVARALCVYPAERFQTADSFWSALRDAARSTAPLPFAATLRREHCESPGAVWHATRTSRP